MARMMDIDGTDIYRAIVRESHSYGGEDHEFTRVYGPFIAVAPAHRAKDRYTKLVSRKIQKLVFDGDRGVTWIDLDILKMVGVE